MYRGSTSRQDRPGRAALRLLVGLQCVVLLSSLVSCKRAHHTIGTVDSQRTLTRGEPIDIGDGAQATSGPASSSVSNDGDDSRNDELTGSAGGFAAPDQGDVQGTQTVIISGENGESFACSREVRTAYNRRLDMYLMVDSNITLPFTGAWDNLVEGIAGYADHERASGTGVGIRFFGLECSASTYAVPDVEVNLLPENARKIRRAFPLPFNFSPMVPALEGAIAHARSRANAHDRWKQVVVYVTDGFSTDLTCLNSLDALVDAAAAGLEPPNPVPTYVVALSAPALVPNSVDRTDRVGPLHDVAKAGGTGQARPLDLQAPSSTMVDMLLEVQRDAEPCEYAVPDELEAGIDTLALALDARSPAEPRVDDADACGDDPGYYFTEADTDDAPEADFWAHACPATCEAIRNNGVRPVLVTPCE